MSVVNGVLVAIPPPPGYVVDFDNPQRQSVEASYAISAVGIAISTFFMCQRLYVKAVLRNTLGVDDLLLVFAWIGSLSIQALIIYSFYAKIMGVHAWEISFETFRQFAIIGGYTTSVVYTMPTTLSKIVILLFYRQIDNPQRWYRWSVNTVMLIVGTSGIAILFSSLFPCRPWQKSWDLNLATAEGTCIDRKAMYSATAGIGVATDVLIIAIPIPMVVSLHMSRAKKIGLIAMFSVGSATVVTSVIRLVLLLSILDDADQTWGGGPVCMWICVEANLLIMCASLATLKHFFKAIIPRLPFSSKLTASSNVPSKASSGNHELRTFGAGSSRRAYYNRFDETDFGTDTVIGVQGLPPKERPAKEEGVEGVEDNASDEGIIQTKTTHVYYEYQR